MYVASSLLALNCRWDQYMADTQQRIPHPHPSILMFSYTQSRYSVVYMLYSYSLLGPINLDAKSLCAEEGGGVNVCTYLQGRQCYYIPYYRGW